MKKAVFISKSLIAAALIAQCLFSSNVFGMESRESATRVDIDCRMMQLPTDILLMMIDDLLPKNIASATEAVAVLRNLSSLAGTNHELRQIVFARAGALLNARLGDYDNEGGHQTPIHQAVVQNDLNAVVFAYLLSPQNVAAANPRGFNPVQLAMGRGCYEIFSFLTRTPRGQATLARDNYLLIALQCYRKIVSHTPNAEPIDSAKKKNYLQIINYLLSLPLSAQYLSDRRIVPYTKGILSGAYSRLDEDVILAFVVGGILRVPKETLNMLRIASPSIYGNQKLSLAQSRISKIIWDSFVALIGPES